MEKKKTDKLLLVAGEVFLVLLLLGLFIYLLSLIYFSIDEVFSYLIFVLGLVILIIESHIYGTISSDKKIKKFHLFLFVVTSLIGISLMLVSFYHWIIMIST